MRIAALSCWAFLIWVLLTWTLTLEQMIIGALVSVAVGAALAPLGEVARPWRLLRPRVLALLCRLGLAASWRAVRANFSLSRRIWSPRLPLRSGMVVTTTTQRSAGGLAAVGVITSLIVDNQLIDLDPSRGELQYHAVAVPEGGSQAARSQINGPVERLLP
jgi:multicomponent Na+:H+ antiporter subunit E